MVKFKLHRNIRQHNQNQKQKQFILLKKCSTQICLRKMTLCFQNVFRDRLINPLLLCNVWSRIDSKGTEATAAHAWGLALLRQEHPGIFEHSRCLFPPWAAWFTVGWGGWALHVSSSGGTNVQLSLEINALLPSYLENDFDYSTSHREHFRTSPQSACCPAATSMSRYNYFSLLLLTHLWPQLLHTKFLILRQAEGCDALGPCCSCV